MKTTKTTLLFIILINVFSSPLLAQRKSNAKVNDALKNETATTIQAGYDAYKKIALNIWDYAEL